MRHDVLSTPRAGASSSGALNHESDVTVLLVHERGCFALEKSGLTVACEVPLPIKYETVVIDAGFRIDMMIQRTVIIENKTVDKIAPIHEAQLLTYLKLTNLKLGFLLNWNVPLMKDGIKRMVNNLNRQK